MRIGAISDGIGDKALKKGEGAVEAALTFAIYHINQEKVLL